MTYHDYQEERTRKEREKAIQKRILFTLAMILAIIGKTPLFLKAIAAILTIIVIGLYIVGRKNKSFL